MNSLSPAKIPELMASDLLIRSATPIVDGEIDAKIKALSLEGFRKWLEDSKSTSTFTSEFLEWASPFGFRELETYGFKPFLTQGVTDGINDFHLRHANRRIRVFRGEYPYTRDIPDEMFRPWLWMDEAPLEDTDALALSFPFSGNGDTAPDQASALETAARLKIPIFIDCAFAGLSHHQLHELGDLSRFESISFSFSKQFALGGLRLGVEFRKQTLAGPIAILNHWDYTPKLAAFLARQLFKDIPFGFVDRKYRDQQQAACAALGLKPSPCVLFGMGEGAAWTPFLRDETYARVCLSPLLETLNKG